MRHYKSLALTAATLLLVVGCARGGHHTHISVESTPPDVIAGFHRAFPGLEISHTDVVRAPDGTTKYELKFRDAAHHYHRKMFSASGQLLDSRENVILAPRGGR